VPSVFEMYSAWRAGQASGWPNLGHDLGGGGRPATRFLARSIQLGKGLSLVSDGVCPEKLTSQSLWLPGFNCHTITSPSPAQPSFGVDIGAAAGLMRWT